MSEIHIAAVDDIDDLADVMGRTMKQLTGGKKADGNTFCLCSCAAAQELRI